MRIRATIVVILIATPVFIFATTSDFTRALKIGMRGEDVRALQAVLNSDPETRIAESGAGSSGNETDYFGPATKRALIKFQEKYRAEVLVPAGLTAGTGFFGEKTRGKALSLRAQGSVANSGASAQKSEAPSVAKGDVYVMFPSKYSGKPGTTITLSGMGFTAKDNTIYFGEKYAVVQASSWNEQSITFKIPNIPKGNYRIWVKNARGESGHDAFFVVTDGVTPEPKIESLSPDKGGRGARITITGSGFTAKENMVRLGTNILEGVAAADGSSISVQVPADALFAATTSSSAKAISVPIWVFVVNENGVSNGKGFTLSL